MDNFYARCVFFVVDTEAALRFYQEQLGFSRDWANEEDGRIYVCQVSLFGFELILNQINERTRDRAGHGRVFIGLEDDQFGVLHTHIVATGIRFEGVDWGKPTLVIRDGDGNELFFWLPEEGWAALGMPAPVSGGTTGLIQ